MKQRSDALPPVLLSDNDLYNIERVWVPVHRPETVHTLVGEHTGDIPGFWVETDTLYVSYRYTAPDGGHLAWYRSERTPKDHPDRTFIEETITEEYRKLREAMS